jgi:hypothetical protein
MGAKLERPRIRSWQKRGFNRVLEFLHFLTCERWLPAACGCALNAERLAQQLLKCGRELAKQRKKYSGSQAESPAGGRARFRVGPEATLPRLRLMS